MLARKFFLFALIALTGCETSGLKYVNSHGPFIVLEGDDTGLAKISVEPPLYPNSDWMMILDGTLLEDFSSISITPGEHSVWIKCSDIPHNRSPRVIHKFAAGKHYVLSCNLSTGAILLTE